MARLLSVIGVIAIAIVIATGSRIPTSAAVHRPKPKPTPTPVALQYEEIGHFMLRGTPEPPGLFQDDRQSIVAAANSPSPQHHGLFGGIMNTYQGAMNALQSLRNGTLTRYTYYNGWIRTDDIVNQTATIEKCNLHEYITLDLAHRTYKIENTLPSPQPAPAPAMPHGGTTTVSEAPGTADWTVTARSQSLGPRTLEGVATHGDSASISMAMTNATGSCRNGSFSMQMVEYVSGIGIPRAYCPLPRASGGAPSSPQQFVVRGGCRPRFHGSASGMFSGTGSSDRLAMYRYMTFGAGSGSQSGGAGMITEAGSVQWLYRPQAQALFSIPSGFTRTQ